MATTLAFRLSPPASPAFAPRLGVLTLTRPLADAAPTTIEIATPGVLACTTRGVVPHLSRDNVRRTPAVRWVHVPFESFLQIEPPIPTLGGGSLHAFLGFNTATTIVSMSLRDPADVRAMPANGKGFVAAQSSRGTRKVTPTAYHSYAARVRPDIVFALADTPFTPPPHSQKRTAKSIERAAQWLAVLLAHPRPSNVFFPMAGGTTPAARAAFAAALQEPLEQKERELLAPLTTLDDGVAGYVFDLAPLRSVLSAADTPTPIPTLADLIRASLTNLPAFKPRLATTSHSPHEVLALVRDAGVDLFDTAWAQRAAAWGVALDFRFPAPPSAQGPPREVGHNLYAAQYAHDFGGLATDVECTCAACAPVWTNAPLLHSAVDIPPTQHPERAPGHTRAYLHHLLHTHEMSAHALLVMHNLAVVDAFMRGVRAVLRDGAFAGEVARFAGVYDGGVGVLEEARACWVEVDLARGKGRLARERARKAAEEAGVDPGEVGAPADVETLEG